MTPSAADRILDMSEYSKSSVHAIPIRSRPPTTLKQRLFGVAFGVVFNTGCLLINGSQILFLLPLRLLIALAPISLMQRLHEAGVRWTKGCAGKLFGGYASSQSSLNGLTQGRRTSTHVPVVLANTYGRDFRRRQFERRGYSRARARRTRCQAQSP